MKKSVLSEVETGNLNLNSGQIVETERVNLKTEGIESQKKIEELDEIKKSPKGSKKKIKNMAIYLLNLSSGLTSNFYNGYNMVAIGIAFPTISNKNVIFPTFKKKITLLNRT